MALGESLFFYEVPDILHLMRWGALDNTVIEGIDKE
jgi:hypothetical protein